MKARPIKKRFQPLYFARLGRSYFWLIKDGKTYILELNAKNWKITDLYYTKRVLINAKWESYSQEEFYSKFTKLNIGYSKITDTF